MNIQYIHPADQLVMFMQRIYDKGMTTMSGGNLSIKDSDGNVWITPGSVDKGTLTRKDIICVHPDGTMEGSHKPSSVPSLCLQNAAGSECGAPCTSACSRGFFHCPQDAES